MLDFIAQMSDYYHRADALESRLELMVERKSILSNPIKILLSYNINNKLENVKRFSLQSKLQSDLYSAFSNWSELIIRNNSRDIIEFAKTHSNALTSYLKITKIAVSKSETFDNYASLEQFITMFSMLKS